MTEKILAQGIVVIQAASDPYIVRPTCKAIGHAAALSAIEQICLLFTENLTT
jgi:hypothetical protein